jgi:hypothetical protein
MRKKKENKQENYKAWNRRRRESMYKKEDYLQFEIHEQRKTLIEEKRNKMTLRTIGYKMEDDGAIGGGRGSLLGTMKVMKGGF